MNRTGRVGCAFILVLAVAEAGRLKFSRDVGSGEDDDPIGVPSQLFKNDNLACSRDLSSVTAAGTAGTDYNFICDRSNPWLHYDGKSWAPATPPFGCHEYVFMQGTPPACTVGDECEECRNPTGTRKYTLKLAPDGRFCKNCVPGE
eukprot:gnl/TRDRNA2_/TRDRNA2_185459_c0_seq1.p1 gnl/TRDRNA2_/TRDRNA2_185459_c0~~gnl/TRDRNA2_/TRDRNA2_185459_c0_seq1.p1  ORF type:complete len:146 (+),score=27.36 gnl/TRDRNA2_/TRDRNA2_185459_c0_seq1:116-553(+)